MESNKTKMQILREAVHKHGTLTRGQLNKLARKYGHSETGLTAFYFDHYNDIADNGKDKAKR